MELVIDAHVIWNILITVVLAPLGFLVRSVLSEQKRLDIIETDRKVTAKPPS